MLANNGEGDLPFGIVEIKDQFGNIEYRRQGDGAGQIIKPEYIHAMDDMMGEVIKSGTGKRARLKLPAMGKTGTSQSYRDAWFIGYTRKFVAGVWVGNDNNAPMREVTGGGLPALIWQRIMSYAHSGNIQKHDLLAIKSKPNPQPTNKSFWDQITGGILSLD